MGDDPKFTGSVVWFSASWFLTRLTKAKESCKMELVKNLHKDSRSSAVYWTVLQWAALLASVTDLQGNSLMSYEALAYVNRMGQAYHKAPEVWNFLPSISSILLSVLPLPPESYLNLLIRSWNCPHQTGLLLALCHIQINLLLPILYRYLIRTVIEHGCQSFRG